MRKIHLLNAAVMPHEGVYNLERLSADKFKESVIDADAAGILHHYIGYESTLKLIEVWTGVRLGNTNVEQVKMKDQDRFLVMRFWRRLNRDEKIRTMSPDAHITVEDFEFYSGTYYKDIRSIYGKQESS